MRRTVHDLRNEIRLAVGRFEREESTAFTKETLAAVCEAFGHDVGPGRLPPKPEMRATILRAVGELDADDAADVDRSLRKAELEAIADALGGA